jgi:transposase-like protein
MKWKDMDGQERYRVVEMARKGQVPIKEICETFSVSRQTLYRAMEKADEVSIQALRPQKAGRKGKSEQQQALSTLTSEKSELEKELMHWKTKYEIAKTFLDLERMYDRGQPLPGDPGDPGEKKLRNRRKQQRKRRKQGKQKRAGASTTPMPAGAGGPARMGSRADGGADGHDVLQSGPLDRPAAKAGTGLAKEARPAGGDPDRSEVEDP